MRSNVLFLGATLLATAVLAGCSGGSANMSIDNGKGHLAVHLTDAPLDLSTVASVTVTIESVTVYPGVEEIDGSGTSPIVLMSTPATFDLLTLTGGATTLLADGDLPAGFYQRIRLGISSAELLFTDGGQEDLKIESGKVDIPIPFELSVDELLVVTLDFDAAASVMVNETGNDKYILRPVVTPVQL